MSIEALERHWTHRQVILMAARDDERELGPEKAMENFIRRKEQGDAELEAADPTALRAVNFAANIEMLEFGHLRMDGPHVDRALSILDDETAEFIKQMYAFLRKVDDAAKRTARKRSPTTEKTGETE